MSRLWDALAEDAIFLDALCCRNADAGDQPPGTLQLLVEARVANAVHLGFTLLLFTAHAMKTTTTASATSVSVPFPQWWIVWGFTQF